MQMFSVLVMSVLIEAVITYIKTIVVDKNIKWQVVVSMILSTALCVIYGLDIPALVGIVSPISYVGSILTGILVSRGSNYIFDLLKTITSKKSVAADTFGADASEGVEI